VQIATETGDLTAELKRGLSYVRKAARPNYEEESGLARSQCCSRRRSPAHFADLDRIESELKQAAKAITSVSGLVAKYRSRLQELCDSAVAKKMPIGCELSARIG